MITTSEAEHISTAMSGVAMQAGMDFVFYNVLKYRIDEPCSVRMKLTSEEAVPFLQNNCVGFVCWQEIVNQGSATPVEKDPEAWLSVGTLFGGYRACWVSHRGASFVWIEKKYLRDIMDPERFNNVEKLVEKAIVINVPVKAPDPRSGIIPLCVSIPDLDAWGCPSCGYSQGVIGQAKEGTVVWICRSCGKPAHAVVPMLDQSTIQAFETEEGMKPFFPKRKEHPRKGMPKKAL
jgi:hypothetical protein